MMNNLIIGSRGSRLALWQSEWVKNQLSTLYPELKIKIEIIKTSGDVNTQQPLTVIGGKGVFTKELEEALLDQKIDLAVHSLKDLPTILHTGLTLAAIAEREDPRDALIIRKDLKIEKPSIATLPQNAIVGTSSQRRLAQLRAIRSDVRIKDLRGNVDTRLRKLDEGQYDAIILASAGLRRLGWAERISAPLSTEEMLPAVGQGALGLETRADDEEIIALVQALNHQPTNIACKAERAFLRGLGGGCQLPIAGYALVKDEKIFLSGLLASADFNEIRRDKIEGVESEAEQLGETLAVRLLGASNE
jgi:hydroxymethylbilane synthase